MTLFNYLTYFLLIINIFLIIFKHIKINKIAHFSKCFFFLCIFFWNFAKIVFVGLTVVGVLLVLVLLRFFYCLFWYKVKKAGMENLIFVSF